MINSTLTLFIADKEDFDIDAYNEIIIEDSVTLTIISFTALLVTAISVSITYDQSIITTISRTLFWINVPKS